MGVDWIVCECGRTFPDPGDYAFCEHCGGYLCPDCMRELNVSGSLINLSEIEGDELESAIEDEYSQCPFCSGDIITDSELLEFAINQPGTTREGLIEKHKLSSK